MCTVIVGFEPDAKLPVVIAGVRDEFAERHWEAPDRHWADYPGLVGGVDLRAGGTWLAADPAAPRVAALLNGMGVQAPEEIRRSRGDLPLRVAAAGELPDADLGRYDPFHLLLAEPSGVRLWSWDGAVLSDDKLPEGVHMIVNSGWEQGPDNPRVASFLPRFAAAARPAPGAFWGGWLELASGAGLAADDPRALIVRRDLGEGGVWGSSSVTLIALGGSGMRYDFCPRPGDQASWYQVLETDIPKPDTPG